MRIVIEVDGEKVTAIGPDAAPAAADPSTMQGDALPGPLPPELLERATKLGAMSAGPAQFGRGAALASATSAVEPKPTAGARSRTGVRKKTSVRKRSRR